MAILPMTDLAIIADGALRIRDGRIVAAGPRAEIERFLSADTAIVDAGGRMAAIRPTPSTVTANASIAGAVEPSFILVTG